VRERVNGAGGPPPGQAFSRLEDVASFQVLQSRLAAAARTGPDSAGAPKTEVPVEALVQAALSGNKIVLGFLDQVAQAFGLALNQLNCAFNPQKIILAGAFTVFGEVFLRRLQQSLSTFAPPSGAPLVVNTQLGPFNGAIGAAALAVHEWKPLPC
jgi:predicted NBD/HSP70 family sugar kinase